MLDVVCRVPKDLVVSLQREYRAWSDGKQQPRLRPDLRFDGDGIQLLSDVAITTPTAPSLLRKGTAKTGLLAARTRETEKRTKYNHIARAEELELHPFVLESYGGWGQGARTVLGKMAEAGVLHTGGGDLSETDALQHARQTIAIALVQGNARLFSNAIALSRPRPPPVPAAAPAPARNRARPLSVVRRSASAAAAAVAVPVTYLQQLPRPHPSVAAMRRYGPRRWS